MLFYTANDTVLFLDSSANGDLIPFDSFDSDGGSLRMLAATTDELGVPSAFLVYNAAGQQTYTLTIAQPGNGGGWLLTTCESYYLSAGQAIVLPAPAGSAEDGGPSLFAFFLGTESELLAASVYPGDGGCFPTTVITPINGGEIDSVQLLAGATCTLDNGDPGACLALGGYSDTMSAVAIDLRSPGSSLTDPLVLSNFPASSLEPAGLSAVVTGPPGSELFTATWYEGFVDPVPGQLVAQQVHVASLGGADAGELPPPLSFDAGIDPDAGTPLYSFSATLALSSGGLPFVIAQGRSNQIATFEPPPRNFAFDLVTGAPFPDLPSDAGVVASPFGFVDGDGNPVVGLAADDLASLNAQIWTYYP